MERATLMENNLADLELAGSPLPELAKLARDNPDGRDNEKRTLSPSGIQMFLGSKAKLLAAVVALEVEIYRIRHGSWPAKLADIEADLPADPFTGQPMVFKRTDDGVVIYSVGDNLADDGGKDYRADADDIPFRLLDPDRRNRP